MNKKYRLKRNKLFAGLWGWLLKTSCGYYLKLVFEDKT